MKLLLIAILILTMDLTPPLTTPLAFTPDDLVGSGYDKLDSSGSGSGSGSGEWSEEQGHAGPPARFTNIYSTTKMKKNKDDPNSNNEDTIIAAKGTFGTRNQIDDDSDLIFDVTPWSVDDIRAAIGKSKSKSKSFLENKEVLACIIAGGVTGLVLAVALAAFLIYNMKRKDDAGYTLAQRNASN